MGSHGKHMVNSWQACGKLIIKAFQKPVYSIYKRDADNNFIREAAVSAELSRLIACLDKIYDSGKYL